MVFCLFGVPLPSPLKNYIEIEKKPRSEIARNDLEIETPPHLCRVCGCSVQHANILSYSAPLSGKSERALRVTALLLRQV